MSGWRTVVIEKPVKLFLHDSTLGIQDIQTGEKECIPIDEIAFVFDVSAHVFKRVAKDFLFACFCIQNGHKTPPFFGP